MSLIVGSMVHAVAQQLSHLAAVPGNVAAIVGPCGFLREKNGTDCLYVDFRA